MRFAAGFYSGLKNCLIEDVPGNLVSPIIHLSDGTVETALGPSTAVARLIRQTAMSEL